MLDAVKTQDFLANFFGSLVNTLHDFGVGSTMLTHCPVKFFAI